MTDHRTFRLTVAYEGTRYVGWQVQPNGPTIQAALETALLQVVGESIKIVGSGRTDAGVHAAAQVASFRCGWKHDSGALGKAIATRLSPDIVVVRCESAPDGFHALRDCVEKRYRYRLQIDGPADPLQRRFVYRPKGHRIEPEILNRCSAVFVGTHDFKAFESAGAPRPSTVRTIVDSRWTYSRDSLGRRFATYEVAADGFLYNMVRNLVGTQIEIAREPSRGGDRDERVLVEALRTGDRRQTGPTAPPHGLVLWRAIYPADREGS